MQAKLTLRMDEALIGAAKTEAGRRGKSVSQMVAEYFSSLGSVSRPGPSLPPLTSSLVGLLKGHSVSEGDFREHLQEKYL